MHRAPNSEPVGLITDRPERLLERYVWETKTKDWPYIKRGYAESMDGCLEQIAAVHGWGQV